jgi:hypothetical protein
MQVNDGTQTCPTCLSSGSISVIKAVEPLRARISELEAFIRPFAAGPHDHDCEAAWGCCTCIVDPARTVLGISIQCVCSTALEGMCSGCRASEGSE